MRARRTGRAIASLIETAKLNGVNPHAWLTDTLTKLVNRWPASRIDELMPWAYAKIAPGRCLNGQRAVRAPLTAKAVSVAVQRIVRRLRNSAQEHCT